MPTFGNICAKHPELLGERVRKSECAGCYKERNSARYAGNKDAMRAAAKANYANNRDRILAARKAARVEKSEKLRPEREEAARVRHAAALEKAAAYHAEYFPKWVERNKTRVRELSVLRTKKWRGANSELIKERANSAEGRAYRAARRAANKLATPSWANKFFISEVYALAKLREKVCGGKWHVDHIVPLKSSIVCGLHWEGNMQVIPAKSNSSKGNRHWPGMPQYGGIK